jgi:hypothetical protein
MKYLLTFRRNTTPMPIEQAAALFEAAKLRTSIALAEGRMDCAYAFGNTKGGVVILNVESHEDLWDGIVEHPMYMFFEWEVEPLCDLHHGLDKLIEVVETQLGE